eukprot:scaffold13771_cov105-Isochrysis_galbana.AAC.3
MSPDVIARELIPWETPPAHGRGPCLCPGGTECLKGALERLALRLLRAQRDELWQVGKSRLETKDPRWNASDAILKSFNPGSLPVAPDELFARNVLLGCGHGGSRRSSQHWEGLGRLHGRRLRRGGADGRSRGRGRRREHQRARPAPTASGRTCRRHSRSGRRRAPAPSPETWECFCGLDLWRGPGGGDRRGDPCRRQKGRGAAGRRACRRVVAPCAPTSEGCAAAAAPAAAATSECGEGLVTSQIDGAGGAAGGSAARSCDPGGLQWGGGGGACLASERRENHRRRCSPDDCRLRRRRGHAPARQQPRGHRWHRKHSGARTPRPVCRGSGCLVHSASRNPPDGRMRAPHMPSPAGACGGAHRAADNHHA